MFVRCFSFCLCTVTEQNIVGYGLSFLSDIDVDGIVPVCPADAASEVIEASRYVSEFRGGEGAVRDIVEQVLRARGDWARDSMGVTPSSLVASR